MSSIALSGGVSSVQNAGQSASAEKAVSTSQASIDTTTQAKSGFKEDTVKLSAAAQAKLMHREGQSASSIASSLGTNVKTVDGYLNITVASDTTTTTTSSGGTSSSSTSTSSSSSTAATETSTPTVSTASTGSPTAPTTDTSASTASSDSASKDALDKAVAAMLQ